MDGEHSKSILILFNTNHLIWLPRPALGWNAETKKRTRQHLLGVRGARVSCCILSGRFVRSIETNTHPNAEYTHTQHLRAAVLYKYLCY